MRHKSCWCLAFQHKPKRASDDSHLFQEKISGWWEKLVGWTTFWQKANKPRRSTENPKRSNLNKLLRAKFSSTTHKESEKKNVIFVNQIQPILFLFLIYGSSYMIQVVLSSFILSSIWGITEFRIQKNGKKEKENSFRSYTDSNKQAIKTSTLKIEIGRRTQKQKQRRNDQTTHSKKSPHKNEICYDPFSPRTQRSLNLLAAATPTSKFFFW